MYVETSILHLHLCVIHNMHECACIQHTTCVHLHVHSTKMPLSWHWKKAASTKKVVTPKRGFATSRPLT